MITLSTLKNLPGAVKGRKRVGRGPGSGHGKTSCRGHKGQKARSGGKIRPGFEGGQMPLYRRLPKRGFNNKFRKIYSIINLDTLNRLGLDEITPQLLYERNVADKRYPVKILARGEITKKIIVKAHKFSESAKKKIEEAGGKWEEIE